MIKQKQETGVRKWFGDDFLKIQNELFRALEDGLLKSITGGVILSGCEVTANGSNWDVAEGMVYLHGSICSVTPIINTTLPIYLTKKETLDSKTRQYADGNVKGIENSYTVNVSTFPPFVGASAVAITNSYPNYDRMLFPYYNGTVLSGIPKSGAFNLNDQDVLATIGAVNSLRLLLSQDITQNTNNIAQNAIDIEKNKKKINAIIGSDYSAF